MKENQIFLQMCQAVSDDKYCRTHAIPGRCGEWVGGALKVLDSIVYCEDVTYSARRCLIELGVTHTFIKIEVNDKCFIMDGTGHASQDPYFGPLESAPEILQVSTSDPMNLYRSLNVDKRMCNRL